MIWWSWISFILLYFCSKKISYDYYIQLRRQQNNISRANKSEKSFEQRTVSCASPLHRHIVHSTCSIGCVWWYSFVFPSSKDSDFSEYDVFTFICSVGSVVLYGSLSNTRKSHGKSSRTAEDESRKCSRVSISPFRILLFCAILPHHVVLGRSILMAERHVFVVFLMLSSIFFVFFIWKLKYFVYLCSWNSIRVEPWIVTPGSSSFLLFLFYVFLYFFWIVRNGMEDVFSPVPLPNNYTLFIPFYLSGENMTLL